MFRKFVYAIIILITTLFIAACSRPQPCDVPTLSTHTEQSKQIDFGEVPQSARTVYLKVKNQSGKSYFDLSQALAKSFEFNGYRVVEKPQYAHFVVDYDILRVGHASDPIIEAILNNGYGGSLHVCLRNVRKQQLAVAIADLKISEKTLYTATSNSVQTARLAVIANQMNIKVKDAEPALAEGLVDSFGKFM